MVKIMNEIEIVSKIKREKLDERNYFKTLIEDAYENQMITENDIVNLQMQSLQLLDEKIYFTLVCIIYPFCF